MSDCVTPPQEVLIEPCKKPEPETMKTNRDLVVYLSELLTAFDVCASKVDAIRGIYDRDQ